MSTNDEIIVFTIESGSRTAARNTYAMAMLAPGDQSMIEKQLMTVKHVGESHIVGSPAYRMDNIIGVTALNPGDDFFTDLDGRSIASFVELGDYVMIRDEAFSNLQCR